MLPTNINSHLSLFCILCSALPPLGRSTQSDADYAKRFAESYTQRSRHDACVDWGSSPSFTVVSMVGGRARGKNGPKQGRRICRWSIRLAR